MKVIGIMSGSSMDGTDLALCEVQNNGGQWKAEILAAKTYPMEEKWRIRLSQLRYQNSEVYAKTDVFYGKYLGELVNEFLSSNQATADLVASHGHTIFHDPEGWLTAQVGDGATLNATCNLPVVSNFRRADVALGGQGAPLVSTADEILFQDFALNLNLGGFCNISGIVDGKREAFDIGPCNIILNRLAREKKQKFDKDGQIAETGEIIFPLLRELNEIEYYQYAGPKTLNREWINKEFWHIVRNYDTHSTEDKMKTLVAHIAAQVAKCIDYFAGNNGQGTKVLITGGGVHNPVLMEFLQSETEAELTKGEGLLADYKEALSFALLGAMRVSNLNNTIPSSTGAQSAAISGSLDGNFSSLIGK